MKATSNIQRFVVFVHAASCMQVVMLGEGVVRSSYARARWVAGSGAHPPLHPKLLDL